MPSVRKTRKLGKHSEKVRNVKVDRYNGLKAMILEANANQKTGDVASINEREENPNSRQAMKASEKSPNPLNRPVLPTQVILNLIKEYDKSFFNRITTVCTWRKRGRGNEE